MIVYALNEILINESDISDVEVEEVIKAVQQTGIEYHFGDVVFHPFDGVIAGFRKGLSREEGEALLFKTLWKIKPYPKWLMEIARSVKFSGNHYTVVVPGEDRFTQRERLSHVSKLVLNTGSEDIYVSRYKVNEDGVYVQVHGNDVIENLRRAYSILRHMDLNNPVHYDTIRSLDCHCDVPDLSEISGLVKALEIFRNDLIDVRIPYEACLISRRDRVD